MELIDVLTIDGDPTGLIKAKPDVHRDGDWHRAAHLWLVTSDGRLLLQRRSDTKENWPGLWDISVAGHIAAGESALDAITREAFEEIGLTIDPSALTHLGTLRYHATLNDGAYIENEFHEVYLAAFEGELASLRLQASEVAAVALVRPDELDRYALVEHPEEYALLREALRARGIAC